MPGTPRQTDNSSGTITGRTQRAGASTLKQRAAKEVLEFLAIVLYLWVMFGVFALHESLVLEKNHINYRFYGFALVNSLVFGKVMLIALDLRFGDWLKDRPLVYPIVLKAVAFAILFLAFHVMEEAVVALMRGRDIASGIANIGGGGLSGVSLVALIIAVGLVPFFFFKEIGRVLGEPELRSMLFTEVPGGGHSGPV